MPNLTIQELQTWLTARSASLTIRHDHRFSVASIRAAGTEVVCKRSTITEALADAMSSIDSITQGDR